MEFFSTLETEFRKMTSIYCSLSFLPINSIAVFLETYRVISGNYYSIGMSLHKYRSNGIFYSISIELSLWHQTPNNYVGINWRYKLLIKCVHMYNIYTYPCVNLTLAQGKWQIFKQKWIWISELLINVILSNHNNLIK